jgi:hypothetical protein
LGRGGAGEDEISLGEIVHSNTNTDGEDDWLTIKI